MAELNSNKKNEIEHHLRIKPYFSIIKIRSICCNSILTARKKPWRHNIPKAFFIHICFPFLWMKLSITYASNRTFQLLKFVPFVVIAFWLREKNPGGITFLKRFLFIFAFHSFETPYCRCFLGSLVQSWYLRAYCSPKSIVYTNIIVTSPGWIFAFSYS